MRLKLKFQAALPVQDALIEVGDSDIKLSNERKGKAQLRICMGRGALPSQ